MCSDEFTAWIHSGTRHIQHSPQARTVLVNYILILQFGMVTLSTKKSIATDRHSADFQVIPECWWCIICTVVLLGGKFTWPNGEGIQKSSWCRLPEQSTSPFTSLGRKTSAIPLDILTNLRPSSNDYWIGIQCYQ